MDHIASLLRLTVDPSNQRSSEQQLRSIEDSTPEFPIILLQIQKNPSFPQWESLLPSLVQNINLENLDRTITILGCLNTIFKKYRYESRTDRLFAEIKFVLQSFAPTYFQIYRLLDERLDREAAEKNKLALLKCIFLMNRIFYSLNFQDLPEFFEDKMRSFVGFFAKYLELNMQISHSSCQDDDEEGPLEKLRVSVLQNINLYVSKYAEDFPFIEQFVQAAWRVLGGLSTATKYDPLASASMLLLETVSKQFTFKHLFADEAFLGSIVERILLPNILLRPQDIEFFEDEPLEWVRKDAEGGSSAGSASAGDSRRASATELVKGLLTFHQAVLLPLLLGQVTKLLQVSSQSTSNWKYKDAAIFLFTAASSSGTIVTAHGISQVNPVVQGQLQAFFDGYILPELINASHALVLVDSLGFLVAFRNQLQTATLVKVFPLVVSLLSSSGSNEAVSTSAAIAIDRLLSMPSGKEEGVALAHTAASSCQQIVSSLLSCLNSSGRIGNEFIIKALLRLILVAKQNFAPYYAQLLAPLNGILQQLLSTPSNPKFNHFLFESIAFLTRYSCMASEISPETSLQNYNVAENVLFATLQKVLQQDVAEFVPYVFQILALLLYVAPKTCTAPSSAFSQLLSIVMHPSAWTTPANFPSLVKLLICFVRKWPSSFQELGPLMGIVQALLKSKSNDLLAIGMWNAMVQKLEPSLIKPFVRPMLLIVLQKLQASKTPRTIHISLLFICNFIAFCPSEDKSASILQALEEIQPGLAASLIGNVLCPEAELLTEPNEKFMVLLAFARLVEPLQRGGVTGLPQAIVHSMDSLCKATAKGSTFLEAVSTPGEEGLESNAEAGVEDENQVSCCRMAATSFIGSSAFIYRAEAENRGSLMQELRAIVERIRFSGVVGDSASIANLLSVL